jgi:tRNA C32,U32 (ribose-2'-O)-methylase TrmJ
MAYVLRALPDKATHKETIEMKGATTAQIKANFERLEKTYEVNSASSDATNDALIDSWRHMQESRGWK